MATAPKNSLLFGVGSWRMLLAVLVVASHLWANMLQGYAAYAVWAFFALSGYLMTYVLMHKYGASAQGLKDFAFNRIIRIYPSYYLAFVFGLIVLVVLKNYCIDGARLNPEFYMPYGWGWLNPLTLLPVFSRNGLPVAVSNALSVEVGVYFLMPLFARSRSTAWLALILSIIATWDLGFSSASFADRYVFFLPCLMSFAVGSLLCHYREHLLMLVMPKTSFVVWMVHGALWLVCDSWPWTYGMYTGVVLSAWVTLSLTAYKSSKVDALLGDMSYPMYLTHTTVGGCFLLYFGYGRSFEFFVTSFAVALVLSLLMALMVERPLHRLKRHARVHDSSTALTQQQDS